MDWNTFFYVAAIALIGYLGNDKLQRMTTDIKSGFENMSKQVTNIKNELEADMEKQRKELRDDHIELEKDMKKRRKELRKEQEKLESRVKALEDRGNGH